MYNDEIRRLPIVNIFRASYYYVRTADEYYNIILYTYITNVQYYISYGTIVAAAAAANGNLFTKGRR